MVRPDRTEPNRRAVGIRIEIRTERIGTMAQRQEARGESRVERKCLLHFSAMFTQLVLGPFKSPKTLAKLKSQAIAHLPIAHPRIDDDIHFDRAIDSFIGPAAVQFNQLQSSFITLHSCNCGTSHDRTQKLAMFQMPFELENRM